jgi:hypothetical protein
MIPLQNANSSLALPTIVRQDGIIYVAYRTFDLLRFSNQLRVLAYDLRSNKELRNVLTNVPKVHGARASSGLALSKDGQTLAYSELYDPFLILLLSTKDLSEIRRSTVPPFGPLAHQRTFVGFDGDELGIASNEYQYGKPDTYGLRFIRLGLSDLKPASDRKIQGIVQHTSEEILWNPETETTWVKQHAKGADIWKEYTELGQSTGEELQHRNDVSYGAIVLGRGKLLAFYGNMVAKGKVLRYGNHQTRELELGCVPRSYGVSNDPEYAGAICTTNPDRELEHGGNKTLSSEFLLLKTVGPAVIWRENMSCSA